MVPVPAGGIWADISSWPRVPPARGEERAGESSAGFCHGMPRAGGGRGPAARPRRPVVAWPGDDRRAREVSGSIDPLLASAAYASAVAGAPVAATLLGDAVVLWRTADGRPHAMRDLCIHRGTALSLGWVEDDCLVCPHHAWRYDAAGACVRIPQSASATIPAKARTLWSTSAGNATA
ncbi:MAG: Rieske 2Fe-2S domain-containing protein [Vicinamibacterales bacterium]